MTKIAESNTEELLESIPWPFAVILGCLGTMILVLQGIFSGISQLYFPHAYEAVVYPYSIYALYFLWAKESSVTLNPHRPALMMATFLILLTPAFYLLLTGQVDLHTMIFGGFNPELKHMPLAWVLPYLCFVALLVPLPSRNPFRKR